jgi:hypothetical protein
MNLSKPDWVHILDDLDGLFPFEWSEDLAYGFAERRPGRISKILDSLNPYCYFAVGLFSVEWLYWNWREVRPECDDVLNQVEAQWAAMLNADYFQRPDSESWTEAGFGPSGFDAFIKERLFFIESDSRFRGGSDDVERLAHVVRHALGGSAVFEQSLAQYLKLLQSLYVWEEGDILKVVPRDLGNMTTDEASDVSRRVESVRAYLALVNGSENPYLPSAEALRARGFSGEPYVL